MAIKERTELSAKESWNVAALYPSLSSWKEEFQKLLTAEKPPYFPQLLAFKNQLSKGPGQIKAALEMLLDLSRRLEKLFTYVHLRHDEEITNDAHKQAFEKIRNLLSELDRESAWFQPELLSLSEEQIQRSLSDPQLAPYRFYLEKIFRMRPHTLTADQEELLALAERPLQTASKAFSSLNNADLRFGKVLDGQGKELELTHGLYQLYLRSPDRTLRENAFKQMQGVFASHENTLAELISGQVNSHIFHARARKFASSLDASLFPKNIDTAVYRSLISSVRAALPSLHRYVRLRKKLLKLNELHLYDLYAPLVPQVEMKLEYSEAVSVVIDSVAPLGAPYQELLRKGLLTEGWVDPFENRNKRSGAYSGGCYDSFPYILMNYRGTLRDVFTLAHECGHSMHSLLSHTHLPYHDAHYPIFVAEVASTFNEELLTQTLLQRMTKKEERAFLINEKIEDIRATFFRQTLFAEFELQIHEDAEQGIPLTPTHLKKTFYALNCAYFGADAFVDREIEIEWARIPHFYYNFYVFQYATGLSAALHLAERVLRGDEGAAARYLTFLQSGGSRFPLDLLKVAGVDMCSPEPVLSTIRHFDNLVTELEKLLG